MLNYKMIANESDSSIWVDKPTVIGIICYTMITPAICCMGTVGNGISVFMLSKTKIRDSFYVYLQCLATINLISCMLLALSSFINGLYWDHNILCYLELYICLPLFNILRYIGTTISVIFILDRSFLMRRVYRLRKPNFCQRIVARRICYIITVLIIVINIPFFFIYELDDGLAKVSDFFISEIYFKFSWFIFCLFTVLPSFLLVVGVSSLIISLKKAIELKRQCCKSNKLSNEDIRRKKQQKTLAFSLIIVIILFVIGDVPAQIVSRYMATSILYNGNHENAKSSFVLEIVRQLTTISNAISISSNFPLFCSFCPQLLERFNSYVESVKRWPFKKRKRCNNKKCFSEGICNCNFLNESLANNLVRNTFKLSFVVVKLKPLFTDYCE